MQRARGLPWVRAHGEQERPNRDSPGQAGRRVLLTGWAAVGRRAERRGGRIRPSPAFCGMLHGQKQPGWLPTGTGAQPSGHRVLLGPAPKSRLTAVTSPAQHGSHSCSASRSCLLLTPKHGGTTQPCCLEPVVQNREHNTEHRGGRRAGSLTTLDPQEPGRAKTHSLEARGCQPSEMEGPPANVGTRDQNCHQDRHRLVQG